MVACEVRSFMDVEALSHSPLEEGTVFVRVDTSGMDISHQLHDDLCEVVRDFFGGEV